MVTKCFDSQIAVVTGAGSGIGQAIAVDLAVKGAKVMILGRTLNKLEETKELIENQGGFAECYVTDVTDVTVVENVVAKIYEKYGNIEILVCNAGNTTVPTYGTKMDMMDFDSVIKTHIYGTMYLVQACGEKMKKNNYGRIIIISSLASIYGLAGQVNYAVAKTGLMGLTYTLAKELGPHGITVNAIQPGLIVTPMAEALIQREEENFIQDTPVRRIGKPEDVAHAASFLCMKESSFITGLAMAVDGGYITNCGMDQLVTNLCNLNDQ